MRPAEVEIKPQFVFPAEHHGFIEAIRDNPEDVTARCVYADWLQDREMHYSPTTARRLRDERQSVTLVPCPAGRVWCGPLLSFGDVTDVDPEVVGDWPSKPWESYRNRGEVFSGPAATLFVVEEQQELQAFGRQIAGDWLPDSLWSYRPDVGLVQREMDFVHEVALRTDAAWIAAKLCGGAVCGVAPSRQSYSLRKLWTKQCRCNPPTLRLPRLAK